MTKKQSFMNQVKRGLKEQAAAEGRKAFEGQEFATATQLAPVFGYSTRSGYFKKQWLEPLTPIGDRYCIEDMADAYIQGLIPVYTGKRGKREVNV